MRRLLLRLLGVAALLIAATLAWVVATLPPAAVRPSGQPAHPNRLTGAYHVHSARSDGSGSADDIAAAAAKAGLGFVIITDHGDATRPPDPPQYKQGVLIIDAVEISTTGGHVVALNLPGASAYPLAGETRDVIEDIHRMGGLAVAAHPDSPRPALRWRGAGLTVDGIEWFNADSEAREHPRTTLVAAAARALFRAPEAVASLFQSSNASLARWDAATRFRPTFSLAAVDAHARLGADADGGDSSSVRSIAFPGYATMFRTIAQTVVLEAPPTGDAAIDAGAVLAALGSGRSYSVVRAFIDSPFALEFAAIGAAGRVDFAGTAAGDSPMLRAAVGEGTGARLVLLANGREVASGPDKVEFRAPAGAYRVEARLPGRPTPWIVSNVIWVGARAQDSLPPPTSPACSVPATLIPGDSWAVEKDRTSAATIETGGADLRVQYRLGPGAPAGQYAALASGAAGETAIECITFVASSPKPMRLSVQIRARGNGGLRWGRSVYVDATPRPFSVALADLDPLDRRSPLRPIAARVQSILLVVDTLNAKPGTEGAIVFKNLGFVPARGGS